MSRSGHMSFVGVSVRRRVQSQVTDLPIGWRADTRSALRARRSWSMSSICRSSIVLSPGPSVVSLPSSSCDGQARTSRRNSLTLSRLAPSFERPPCAALARYEPESLGVETRQGRTYSRLLEFFAQLINAEHQPVPLPKAPLNEVLATTRPLFGTEVIEYRLPTETRLGAMLGIKEYPTPTYVGLYNALLSAPFPFVLTQSFTFLTKATAQGLLQRQSARMANAGDFAVTQAAELMDALDALTGQ